jgi:hypothetical protein
MQGKQIWAAYLPRIIFWGEELKVSALVFFVKNLEWEGTPKVLHKSKRFAQHW